MPSTVPDSLDGWWCDSSTEYAFVGFSYEVTACQSRSTLNSEFKDIRETFDGRYVRLYGACDRTGFYDDVIDAAWNNGLGVHALIWFGFEGGSEWKDRRDNLIDTLWNNPKAKFVTRAVQFGSEPLYDYVLDPSDLAGNIWEFKWNIEDLGIPVTISELAYGYQVRGGAQIVLDSIDVLDAHILPYFSQTASTGDAAWKDVNNDLNWFIDHAAGRKIWFSQNGWPSTHYSGVEPNSPDAVADVDNEERYYKLLESKCEFFKSVAGGGVGWFWHIYADWQEPGYGLYAESGKTKFDFKPRTEC
ncbi:glycoside hydrolase family 17 protein [Cylindrobasidium torrendii FP15055 ss-10]|uniref:glucan endo-1,3-beta-D-glucosidase n=1 Tax=Cylindrobasidium torrendii FP15055 ss-10 TaxID=1314674 RepID=A0A0D7BGW0_9AGAR|nr:glycoside hydrolase family 17 protein [Cylindrobasidium torrendii FP15055 ss-10]